MAAGRLDGERIVRVYYHARWVQTVHPSVQKYCLVDTDPVTGARK